jgi:hypothetical protein
MQHCRDTVGRAPALKSDTAKERVLRGFPQWQRLVRIVLILLVIALHCTLLRCVTMYMATAF